MPNMSHCRFENTLSDLRDCHDNMTDRLSKRENSARERLIRLCHEIARDVPLDEIAELPIEGDVVLDGDEEDHDDDSND